MSSQRRVGHVVHAAADRAPTRARRRTPESATPCGAFVSTRTWSGYWRYVVVSASRLPTSAPGPSPCVIVVAVTAVMLLIPRSAASPPLAAIDPVEQRLRLGALVRDASFRLLIAGEYQPAGDAARAGGRRTGGGKAGPAGASARPMRPAAPALLEVGRRQIEVVDLDRFEPPEADAAQLRRERRRVADEHDRQPVGLEVERAPRAGCRPP